MAEYAAFLEPDETAHDLFARIVVDPIRTGVPFLDQAVFLRPGHVVEIIGASGCGKSELLVQVSALKAIKQGVQLANLQSRMACRLQPHASCQRR